MVCKKCRNAMGPSDVFCPKCGEKHLGRERAAKRAESERFVRELTPWTTRLGNYLQNLWQRFTGLPTSQSQGLDRLGQQFREAAIFEHALSQGKGRKGVRTSFSLEVGEVAILEEPCVLKEIRKSWQTDGTFIGYGDNLFGGVTQSETRELDSVQATDSGLLCLTDRRLLFRGQTSVRTTLLEKIISASQGAHGLAVAAQGQKTQQLYVVENPLKWEGAIREAKKGT